MASFFGTRAAPAPTPPAYRGPPEASLYIFSAIIAGLIALVALQRPARGSPRWLPAQGAKRAYEVWVLRYSAVWMGIFGSVVVAELYEKFDATGYFLLCGGLALPLVVQPVIHSRSAGVWHAGRAQLWIAIFGFIGNYWYTHYFYVVLRARYTMPAWRLNDVPIAMYLATHFYFSTYHVLANLALRRVRSSYAAGPARTALQAALVLAMSYAMAFMETLTISNFPYYDFEARWPTPPLRRPATGGRRAHPFPAATCRHCRPRHRTVTWRTPSGRHSTASTSWSPSPCTSPSTSQTSARPTRAPRCPTSLSPLSARGCSCSYSSMR